MNMVRKNQLNHVDWFKQNARKKTSGKWLLIKKKKKPKNWPPMGILYTVYRKTVREVCVAQVAKIMRRFNHW